MAKRDPHLIATRIIRDAGGELVGRTRLQKIAYLLQLAGYGDEFQFEYKHYGPFSEDLARGIEIAAAFGQVTEDEQPASWGGWYSIYRLPSNAVSDNPGRAEFVHAAKQVGAIELELAATAAFLYSVEGIGRTKQGNPWLETRARKPEKCQHTRLARAATAYAKLRQLPTPMPLPDLSSFSTEEVTTTSI